MRTSRSPRSPLARCVAGALIVLLSAAAGGRAATQPGAGAGLATDEVQARVAADVAAGRPIVVHVLVALCDNEHQGIVPVPRSLGNGHDPRSNLYWGARYGVRTFFTRDAGWTRLPVDRPDDARVLDRLLLRADVAHAEGTAHVYVVADAWDGAEIRGTIGAFLALAAGEGVEAIRAGEGAGAVSLPAGGAAHLVAFVGHNGLMDFPLPVHAAGPRRTPAGASVVLACASRAYFLDALRRSGSRPLLLTTGLMAPEAYTLDAVIRAWARGGTGANVRDAAARRYASYQKCGLAAARHLFWSPAP